MNINYKACYMLGDAIVKSMQKMGDRCTAKSLLRNVRSTSLHFCFGSIRAQAYKLCLQAALYSVHVECRRLSEIRRHIRRAVVVQFRRAHYLILNKNNCIPSLCSGGDGREDGVSTNTIRPNHLALCKRTQTWKFCLNCSSVFTGLFA